MNVNEWGKYEKWWRRRDLNPRPKDYDSSALPLSYAAMGKGNLERFYAVLGGRCQAVNFFRRLQLFLGWKARFL